MMKNDKCLNCHTQRRPIYKGGYCKNCYRWARQLSRAVAGDYDQLNQYNRIDAEIALEELKWREEPFQKIDCHPLDLVAMTYAVAAECRSEIGFALNDLFYSMTAEDRFRMYTVLLEIAENTPRDYPVLAMSHAPTRGAHCYFNERHLRSTERMEQERKRKYQPPARPYGSPAAGSPSGQP